MPLLCKFFTIFIFDIQPMQYWSKHV